MVSEMTEECKYELSSVYTAILKRYRGIFEIREKRALLNQPFVTDCFSYLNAYIVPCGEEDTTTSLEETKIG